MSVIHRKMNALLISSSKSGAQAIQEQLNRSTDHWVVWRFMDLEEASDFSLETDNDIHLVILDLSQFSNNNHDPKEAFLRIRKRLPFVPVIAITDRSDYDLMHFSMKEGAADNISFWQIKSDPHHLLNLIDASLARFKIADDSRQDVSDALKLSQDRYNALLEHLNAAKLQFDAFQKASKEDIAKLKQENTRLQEDGKPLSKE